MGAGAGRSRGRRGRARRRRGQAREPLPDGAHRSRGQRRPGHPGGQPRLLPHARLLRRRADRHEDAALYLSEEDYEAVGRLLYATADRGGTAATECKFRRKDGRIIDVILTITAIDPRQPRARVGLGGGGRHRAEACAGGAAGERRALPAACRERPGRHLPLPARARAGGRVRERRRRGALGRVRAERLLRRPALFWSLVHPDDAGSSTEALPAGRPASVVVTVAAEGRPADLGRAAVRARLRRARASCSPSRGSSATSPSP